MENNLTKTFSEFLSLIGAKVTRTTATDYLETRPEHNTMVGYVDALNKVTTVTCVGNICYVYQKGYLIKDTLFLIIKLSFVYQMLFLHERK